MKHKFLYLFTVFAILLYSCKKESDFATPIDVEYQLEVDPNVVTFSVPYQNANVVLINKTNNERYAVKPSSDGKVSFKGITPGTYSINVSLTLTAAEVTALSGVVTEDELQLNFSGDNMTYYDNSTVAIRLITSRPLGNFVLKQVYYAASHTTQGANFRDQFFEIYNNSNETLYADSLCFAIVIGKNNNNTGDYLLSNLQFDWTQSLNMTGAGNANTDYFYAKAIFMIPSNGSGTRYPIEPGKSIIIAGTAVDHTKPYTLASGKEQGIGDATLTIDLSNADFEVYMNPYQQKINPGSTPFASDVDNPGVTDVETIFASGMSDLIMSPQGKDSYVLFKSGGKADPNLFPKFANPTVRSITDKTILYPQVPAKYILDAVEVAAIIEKDKTPRRFPLELDAGNASVTAGPYSGQSVVRKTKVIVNGRRILMDTNNSTQDFGVLTKADPTKGTGSFID